MGMPTATSGQVEQRRIPHEVSSSALQDKTLSGLEGRRHPCLLHRLVHTHAPSQLVMEEPGFYRNPKLSRRLNRLMSNMGASIVSLSLIHI